MEKIKKKFFDAFEIKTKEKSYCLSTHCKRQPSIKFADCETCRNCKNGKFFIMPEITDKHYLELICIQQSLATELLDTYFMKSENINALKKEILTDCIRYHTSIEEEVKNLFKMK